MEELPLWLLRGGCLIVRPKHIYRDKTLPYNIYTGPSIGGSLRSLSLSRSQREALSDENSSRVSNPSFTLSKTPNRRSTSGSDMACVCRALRNLRRNSDLLTASPLPTELCNCESFDDCAREDKSKIVKTSFDDSSQRLTA